jgi:putative sigma-54 modulation protein
MKVNIVGRQIKVPPEAESYARDKFGRLGKYFAGIQHADIVMAIDGHAQQRRHEVEASVTLGHGTRLLGKGAGGDLTAAIDAAEAKLQKQIRRFHARLKAHRDRTRISDSQPVSPEQEEATYEQVVREMLDEEEE